MKKAKAKGVAKRVVKKGFVIWWSKKTPFDEDTCTVYRFKKDAEEALESMYRDQWTFHMWRIRPVTMGCERALKGA